ncbi:MAG: FMN-binding protein [Oscillospiraceae bacterium]|nr:FMN-binding protein [Oscillospiraceae bacterium]
MKRIIALAAALLAIAMPLTSCGSSDGYKDGSYRAEAKAADDHGWKPYLVVTVEDGAVAEVEFDYSNDEGLKKSEDEDYKASMLQFGGTTYPAEFTQKIEEAYLSAQKGADVDTVAGATTSTDDFKKLAAELEKSMAKGKKDIVVVDLTK